MLINPPTLPLNRFLHYNSVAGQIAGNGIKNYSREIVRSVECVIIMRNRFRKIRERERERMVLGWLAAPFSCFWREVFLLSFDKPIYKSPHGRLSLWRNVHFTCYKIN